MIHNLFSQKGKPFFIGLLASIFSLFLGTYTPLFATGIDTYINHKLSPISNFLAGIIFFTVPINGTDVPLIVGWLILAAIVLTIYFRGIQFRGVRHAMDILRGRYYDPKDDGEVSPFQALSTALSGTVGLGNIAGVAVALSIGGPGATFWMIIAGFMGMATKFTECTLGVKYRTRYADGHVSGGPMYYLSKGFAEKGMAKIGKIFATFFAICCVGGALGAGNMFQVNQAFQQSVSVTGGDASFLADKGWLFGLVMCGVVGLVIIGGIKSIGKATEKLVPLMAAIYLGASLIILGINYDLLGHAAMQIISGAFTGAGIAGGALGTLIQGFRRASFSNEAGIGSASIAHAAVQTKEPLTEGYVALLEPFIDTVIICSITSLVIVTTGVLDTGLTGVELTSAAFASLAPWFPKVLAIAVILFALSTMLAWFYYGLKAWTYLFGENQTMDSLYKGLFCVFIVLGASMQLGPIIDFSDAMIFAMAIPNVIGLYVLMPVVAKEYKQYWAKVKSGEIKRV